MLEMERALEEEVNHRSEFEEKLTAEYETRIEDLQRRFEKIIEERTLTNNQRLEDLAARVNNLNCRIREESERIPKDIELKSQDLAEHLKSLQEDFVVERKVRDIPNNTSIVTRILFTNHLYPAVWRRVLNPGSINP